MRLYKMELYKLCRRRIFMIGTGCTIGLLLFFFWIKVSDESSYVDGVAYHGFQAVEINREITEEFKGVLTDEKAEKIIEKYDFPQQVEAGNFYYTDANFLNEWIEKYLSDGYYRRWDDYEKATRIYPTAETDAGEAARISGQELIMEYSDGWLTFFDFLTLAFILGSILTVFSVSVVFADESQTEVLPLLFTTKEGKGKDIYAKIAAAYTVAFGIWLGITALAFFLCGIVYGFDGLSCMVGTTTVLPSGVNIHYRPASMLSVGAYIGIALFRSLLGMLLLCSVTMYISARFRTSFSAVVTAALFWLSPVLMWVLLGGLQAGGAVLRVVRHLILWLVYAAPFYLMRCDTIMNCYGSWLKLAALSAAAMLLFLIKAYWRYKRLS